MAALFGIHFGNTSACIALSKDDERVEVIANDTGDRLTPTTVQWTPSQSLVGRSAIMEQFRNMTSTINRSKQLLNDEITEEELEGLRSGVPFKIHKVKNQIKYEILYEGKQHQVSVKEIILAVFKKLHSIAITSGNSGLELQAVLTVPGYFPTTSIESLKDIAEKAGFSVLQVIDEASAAALAVLPPNKSGKCLVCRVGGVSLDVTVLDVVDGMFTVLSDVHKFDTGGRSITEKLRDLLATEFQRQCRGQEITDRGKFKLDATAETAKQILSIQNSAHCSAESVGGGFDLNYSLSRPRLDNIVATVVPAIIDAINQAIAEAQLSPELIDTVIVCGGTTKIPRVQDQIRALLPRAELLGMASPDEIIAVGAAIQARHCSKLNVDLPVVALNMDVSVTSASVAVNVFNNENNEIISEQIPSGTFLPVSREILLPDEASHAKVAVNADKPALITLEADSSLDIKIHTDGVMNIEKTPRELIVNN